jgi:hypothetical protein
MSDENINYSSNDDANAISYLNERKVELKSRINKKKVTEINSSKFN